MNIGPHDIQSGEHHHDTMTPHTGGGWAGATCRSIARAQGHVVTCPERRNGPFGEGGPVSGGGM